MGYDKTKEKMVTYKKIKFNFVTNSRFKIKRSVNILKCLFKLPSQVLESNDIQSKLHTGVVSIYFIC